DFEDMQEFSPLGKLIGTFDYVIIDDNGFPVAEGEIGELCLIGPQVGTGYYNDPERTAQVFVPRASNVNRMEMMYRTGDRVFLSQSDGKLHIRGRCDYQVKHMGYRIELEEIENALCGLLGVQQAGVVHGEVRGLSRLVAAVSGDPELDPAWISSEVRKIVPQYMVPSEIHVLPSLPTNANGKLDRGSLCARFFGHEIAGTKGGER
ncbi:MAG: AMP-binding protein, partial [Verrucomicrobia bacterium]|nr:AMP-binding protein [Verrucomicrobiota bacterium]